MYSVVGVPLMFTGLISLPQRRHNIKSNPVYCIKLRKAKNIINQEEINYGFTKEMADGRL